MSGDKLTLKSLNEKMHKIEKDIKKIEETHPAYGTRKKGLNPFRWIKAFNTWRKGTCLDEMILGVVVTAAVMHWLTKHNIWIF